MRRGNYKSHRNEKHQLLRRKDNIDLCVTAREKYGKKVLLKKQKS